jgi:hypothetical protein
MQFQEKIDFIISKHKIPLISKWSSVWDSKRYIVEEDDVDMGEIIKNTRPGDPLTYVGKDGKGHYVLAYIKVRGQYNGGYNMPKFHLARCSTLEGFISTKTYDDKYSISNKQINEFEIIKKDPFGGMEKVFYKLDVCKNCLSSLNYKMYKNSFGMGKGKVYDNFSLSEYFSVYIDTSVPIPKRLKIT